jgi:hypothetical protein
LVGHGRENARRETEPAPNTNAALRCRDLIKVQAFRPVCA